jgi:hypothetical protein
MPQKVKRTERGWAGHYISAHRCLFKRNTLLEYKDLKIVVSSVGNKFLDDEIHQVGYERYYETMAFYVDKTSTRFFDIDVKKPIRIDSKKAISTPDSDDRANDMHEAVVDELTVKLLNNQIELVDE